MKPFPDSQSLPLFTAVKLPVFINVSGVDPDEMKAVSVIEGDSGILSTDVSELETDDQILWRYGS